ncbi:MAG: carbohydrate kinase family protein [Anaerolineae bacterium]|nr:carbohydrate kinase family protein [Anaerolineae bacterium]
MDIIVTGSIAYDYIMRFPGRFSEHLLQDQLHQISVSFLVEDMTKQWGGVAANIAYTMGLLGLRPKLFGTVGRDFGDYRNWLERAGVDTSTVRQIDEVFTASFFVNTDLDHNQIASFYSGAMALAKNYTLADVHSGTPDMVVISPNDPQAMMNLAKECRERGIRFIYDPSQQVARLNGDQLWHDLQGAYAMVVNAYEAEIICKKAEKTLEDLRQAVDVLVVTQGKRGSHIYQNGELTEVPVFPTDKIIDPTGLGDAFRAGLLRGIAAGMSWTLSAELGSLCAAYALERVGTQSHHFTLPEFIARFRSEFNDEGALDILLQPAAQA